MQDLFDQASAVNRQLIGPLASRMRPLSLDNFIGQEHLVGKRAPLGTALRRDRLWPVILWGPPGTGKTTLAAIAASMTKSCFISISAVMAGVKDIREAVSVAEEEQKLYTRHTVLFIDEIHRFNKSQQDALLPHVESGTVILWGATTENPYFYLIHPLLSRLRVLKLEPLTTEELRRILKAALETKAGLRDLTLTLEENAQNFIIERSNGDARTALNWLEAVSELAVVENIHNIRLKTVERAMLQRQVQYDSTADHHYHTVSAFIKSIRGSDPDGAIFWLAKMLEAGEDPAFISRRLLIAASEDVGNADPQALPLTLAACQSIDRLGLPEATYPLAQATLFLATAPKSNSAGASLTTALAAIREGANVTVPLHLRNDTFAEAATLGYEQGYRYAHDFPTHFVRQDYLPQSERHRQFYQPGNSGAEVEAARRLRNWWGTRYTRRNQNDNNLETPD